MAGARLLVIGDELAGGLGRLGDQGGDGAAFLASVAGYLLTSTQWRFNFETAPDGSKWKRLAERTAASRIKGTNRIRGNANILTVSGDLYRSILAKSDASEAVVGTNMPYAGIHQEGGTITLYPQSRTMRFRKKGKRTVFARASHKKVTEKRVTFGQRSVTIPARPYLGLNAADEAEIAQLLVDHLSGGAQ